MEFAQVLAARHSVRDFSSRPVPREVLEDILRDASRAPSWVDAQEWKVYVATGKTVEDIRREYLERAAAGQKGAADFPVTPRVEWSPKAQENMAVFNAAMGALNMGEELGRAENSLFMAPAVAFLCLPKNANKWALLDLGAFEQTLMLAAASRGVDSIPAYNLVKYPDVVRKAMGIPDDLALAIGVALGYASDSGLNAVRSPRMALEDFAVFKE